MPPPESPVKGDGDGFAAPGSPPTERSDGVEKPSEKRLSKEQLLEKAEAREDALIKQWNPKELWYGGKKGREISAFVN